MGLRVLAEQEIRSLITLPDAIGAVERAFGALAEGRAVLPSVINLDLPAVRGEVHVKAAYLQGGPHYTVKIASGFYGNPEHGLPVGNGLMLSFDAQTGAPSYLLLDGGWLTELRTAAAGAVAAKYLAPQRVGQVGVIGAGVQARFQLEALRAVRDFDKVKVFAPTAAHVQKYCEEMGAKLSRPVFPALSAREAVEGSSVVITATPSRRPIVMPDWVASGTHITAMGSDGPDKQELATAVLKKAHKVVVDSRAQCERLGELHHAIVDGTLRAEQVHAELGELVIGKKPGRERPEEITVCDLTGVGVQDVAVASFVCERAAQRGLGRAWEG